jgi:F-type H+-transporting ATPase subunit b
VEVNWSTFILEIINFLILVWILKRFLYKPVMDSIAKRRASIEQSMQQATHKDQEAQALKTQYEHRLEDWEREKQEAREQLHAEIDQERQRLQAQLHASLQQEREKAKVLAAQQEQEQQRHYEQQALQNSMRFSSKLLKDLASAELESRLVKRLLEQLAALPDEQRKRLGQALNKHTLTAQIHTAFPLAKAQQAQVQQALQTISERELSCQFDQDASLLAGARIELGPWLLHANLQDELQAFIEFEHHSPTPSDHE